MASDPSAPRPPDSYPSGTAPLREHGGDEDYLFTPDSMIYRTNREALILLGGGRAVLLQLAHPLIAAGVSDYSDFQSDPLARLFRTMSFMHTLVYESDGRSRALRRFHAMHAGIRGRLREVAGPYPAGTRYAGDDPALKLWVHATFLDTILRTYERFVRPLTPYERKQYYAESQILARMMEIPAEIVPDSLGEFDIYMEEMIASDVLTVTDTARGLAEEVLHPEVGLLPSLSAALLRFVTAGLLPERLREEYGLPWDRRRKILLDRFSDTTTFLRPYAPAWVWENPLGKGRLSRLLLGQMP